MSDTANLCVVIPVHKPMPSEEEVLALRACKQHLSAYPRYLLFPVGMDVRAYLSVDPRLKLKPVDAAWQSGIEKYNKMKLSESFYKLFAEYTYMLTYELDAYIFHADLAAANAFKFDYIGAPFFEGYWEAGPGAKFIKGCNSGFSVRNIQSCLKALHGMRRYRVHWLLYKIFLAPVNRIKQKVNQWTKGKYEVFVTGRFAFYFEDFHLNEDVVWSEVIPQLFPWFTVADGMSALKFSFEYNLDESLELNGGRLPLGCHAWAKHLVFWSRYIDTSKLTAKHGSDEV